VLVAAVAVLAACSTDGPERASPSPTPTASLTTASTSTSSSSTTTVASATTVAQRLITTAQAASPEGFARTMYAAWMSGDRAAAGKVAQPQAVDALFALRWQADDGWSFAECSGAAGSVICTWQRPSGQQVLFRVQSLAGGLPVTVSDVRFQP